jgi:hypothetical protein
MKVTVSPAKKAFVPFVVSITFECEDDVIGPSGFATRFDRCGDVHGNFMSYDETCKMIRKAIADSGYPIAPKE